MLIEELASLVIGKDHGQFLIEGVLHYWLILRARTTKWFILPANRPDFHEGGYYIWRKAGKTLKSYRKTEKQRKSARKLKKKTLGRKPENATFKSRKT